ncbi:competence protein ComEA [Granulicatella balaenopterae]|uniref:Competence protein ComEA n=1 Tax=Granulicatella balaenopterae TaxID=137733 RepID=A0A1H9KLI0_9LACT|nr:helix-hairpin-helix domain-containing protein [Granulicatella balaenopterae]SER00021.1 competence protein ComEA [Granulicatella balaenopterae]
MTTNNFVQYVKEKVQEHPVVYGAFALFFLVLVIGGTWKLISKPTPQANFMEIEEFNPSEERSSSEASFIYVDIKGEVQYPGVYQVDVDCRLLDLIDKAGGFTNKANDQQVNLAQKLTDQAMIVIPSIEQVTDNSSMAVEEVMIKTPDSQSGKININTAGIEELTTLSGIGEKKAQQIIDYREENGSFKAVDDLVNVSGIGQKTVEKLKAEVCI